MNEYLIIHDSGTTTPYLVSCDADLTHGKDELEYGDGWQELTPEMTKVLHALDLLHRYNDGDFLHVYRMGRIKEVRVLTKQ